MQKKMIREADSYVAGHRRRRIWQRIVGGLACVVVFCTTYALILPAITMEKYDCGMTEHTHTAVCYTRAAVSSYQEPVCTLENLNLHEHDADCYDEDGTLVCGYADFVVHEHDKSCYDEDGSLWCPLPEIGAHTHDKDCYARPEGVHTHSDDCYTVERGELICTESEEDAHTHDGSCYTEREELVCGQEESDGHQHGDSCYDEAGELICGEEESEGHTHSAGCYETSRVLTCGLSEDAHRHTDECYKQNKVLICDLPAEPEEDSDAEPELVCDKEEIILHTHKDSCFDENGTLICGKQEVLEHVHSADCFQSVETASASDADELTCTIPEGDGAHAHSEDCFDEAGKLVCGLEESEGHQHGPLCYGTWELTCGMEEHTHTDACKKNVVYLCGKEEHTHGDACFDENGELICTLEEHTHTDACIEAKLTAEEQAQVDEVIALIDALPTQEEIEETLAAFEDAEDEDGYDAYLAEIVAQVKEAHGAYEALSEAQKPKVTNAARLMALEPLWSAQTLESTPLTDDDAYIKALGMGTTDQDTGGGITDGSAPWDSSDGDGLDTTANNKRVRTFDTVKYDFYYATGLQDTSSTAHYDSARVYFEFLLPAEQSQAVFSVDEMAWLRADGVSYAYEKEPVTIGNVSYQVLHGSFLDDREGSDITAASRSRDVMIRVLNMKNNSTIQPVFSVWMEYNDVGLTYENNIPAGIAYGNGHTCAAHRKNEVASLTPDAVTVTCTPRYAVTLKRGEVATSSWAGSFDFSTGNAAALDKANETWNGRISGYGIRLMVQGLDEAHGLRGCEFPEPGDTLEFDITLTTAWQNSNGGDWQYITQEFMPKVWSAEEFSDAGTQKDGREVGATKLPKYAAPLNKGENPAASCADGGTWAFTDRGYLTNDSNHRVIHVTVSGYTFDPEHLPHASYGSLMDMDSGEFYNPEEVGNQWWNIQNAVFSTGEMWVVTPFYSEPGTDSNKYITNVKNTSSLTMWQSIFAYNMEVKNKSSQTTYKKDGELDHLDSSVTLQNPGTFNVMVSAIKPVNNWQDPLTDGCFKGENELKDYATPGSYVDLGALLSHDGAEGDAVGVAYNFMVKFDNACFEPVTWGESCAGDKGNLNMSEFPYAGHTWYPWPEYRSSSDYQNGWDAHGPKMLYGTTRDGKGWNHNGQKPDGEGYDTEMMKATPDDLVWYDSMEELKAAGAQCVAVLMEYRNVGNDGVGNPGKSTMNHLHMAVHARIKDTVEPGYVYAVSNYAAVWTKADVQSYVTDVTHDGQIGTMDYLFYTQHDFPSYSPTAANKMDSASFPTPTHERSWNRCTNHGDGESGRDAVNGANGYGTAKKSYVDANGTFIAGSGGYYFQDNVYVVSYRSQVGIQVAQTVTQNGQEAARNTYSMDENQRVADFMITPRFVRSATDTGGGGTTTTMYTDATLTVTLPQGLEYIPGTAFWGGEYTQDSACKAPGTVTGGQAVETTVTQNADGTTTLTWVLKNVPLSSETEDLAPVHFSCRIGDSGNLENDVTNNQTLNVQTDIYSTADAGAVHGAAYNNQATTSIRISKSTALTIIKTADRPIVDIGEDMGFTMQLYNSSDSAYEGWIADVLPYNGVGKTKFNGTLQVEKFKIIGGVDPAWKNVAFYYTTDPQYNNLQDVTNLDVTGWSTFTLDDNYTWTPDTQGQQITAIAYKYTIPGKGRIQMHITLSLPDSRPGDVIHNRLLLNNLISNDSSQIVSRTLEGLTWLDDNADGMQNEAAERRISGVKVTLLKLKDGGNPANESDYEPYCYRGTQTPIMIETGKQISVRASGSTAATDYEQGRYKFTDLPAGTFAVRFTDGNKKISPLIASPDNRGTDDTLDSDGKAAYSSDRSTLEKTVILGIELPKAEDMSVTLFESKYHDSGFYEKGHELPQTGGSGTTPYTTGGLVAAIGAGLLLLYKDKKRRKGDFASS